MAAPMGITGRVAENLFVEQQVNEIFNFGYKKMSEMFD